MPHHSFASPLEYGSLLDDWVVSGASLFERERLLMHPGVPDRTGFVFSKSPLLTNDFEVVFHFRVSSDKGDLSVQAPLDQALAFWYVEENMSAGFNETRAIKAQSWTSGMLEQGFGLVGSRGKFNGFGAVLSVGDAASIPTQGKGNPVVSSVVNDGTQLLVFGKDVPTATAKKFDFRNTLNAVQMRIRVKPTGVQAEMKQSPSLSWQECFKMERAVKPGGYMGFTAHSGTANQGQMPDLVSIVQVDVNNFDENSIGEDMKDVTSKIQDAYREMLTDDNRHFVDQKSQTDHLLRLANMIGEHMNSTKPQDDRLQKELGALGRRMDRLAADCRSMVKETSLLMSQKGKPSGLDSHKQAVELLKGEIIGIRRLLVSESTKYNEKLENLQKNTGEVKAKVSQAKPGAAMATIEKQAESLAKTVSSRGTQMSWMLICLLAAILAIGGLMWNRMNYYEKKHFI